MSIDQFIANFAAQFDETDNSEFQPDTTFRDIDEWDSMVALSILGMVDEEYEVSLTADEMRTANTIKELFLLVSEKK